MDHADEDFDGDIYIYRGGRAPQHITHARIDKSINDIEDEAFLGCENLLQVDTHDGLRKVGKWAFRGCRSLRRINLKSAVEIDLMAFYRCTNLETVEFGDRLETIGKNAFTNCISLTHLKLPSITTIGASAFFDCKPLTDIVFPKQLEKVGTFAFQCCSRLRRITIPLKRCLFQFPSPFEQFNQFNCCHELLTVDLLGEIHKTVASFHMDCWRTEMTEEINRINHVLPNTEANEKSGVIYWWMDSLIDKMDHYKSEHCKHVREGITLLELALWKAKLCEKEDICGEGRAKKVKIDEESARKERRITCGADLVIKNVLPFLKLDE